MNLDSGLYRDWDPAGPSTKNLESRRDKKMNMFVHMGAYLLLVYKVSLFILSTFLYPVAIEMADLL